MYGPGDMFSGSWMRDSETHSLSETLEEQHNRVRRKTTMSHVQVYGDYNNIKHMMIGEFQGNLNHGDVVPPKHPSSSSSSECDPMPDVVSAWEVPYMSLMHQLEDANTTQGMSTCDLCPRCADMGNVDTELKLN